MRPLRTRLFPGALFLFTIAACSPPDDDSADERLEALEDSVVVLAEALNATVDLKPGEDAFSVLRMDVGSLAITLDTVAPYDLGSRLELMVGNLTSAQINQLVATIWWGIPQEDGLHAIAERRSRALTLAQPLPPGAWTRVSFALDSVPPEQIGFIRLSNASATSIQLP